MDVSVARDLLVKKSMLEKKFDIWYRVTIKNKSCPQYVKFQKNFIKKSVINSIKICILNYTVIRQF